VTSECVEIIARRPTQLLLFSVNYMLDCESSVQRRWFSCIARSSQHFSL